MRVDTRILLGEPESFGTECADCPERDDSVGVVAKDVVLAGVQISFLFVMSCKRIMRIHG